MLINHLPTVTMTEMLAHKQMKGGKSSAGQCCDATADDIAHCVVVPVRVVINHSSLLTTCVIPHVRRPYECKAGHEENNPF